MLLLALAEGLPAVAQNVTTSQYDNARTGSNQQETTLTPRNVNVNHFGKIFTLKVDGDIYAQPLFLAGLDIPGKGRHDVLIVATEHDSVYASTPTVTPPHHSGMSTFSATALPCSCAKRECPFIFPEIGITSTPVIDPNTGTLYVLARTKGQTGSQPSHYTQRLHALAITTGLEKFGGPVEISATINGSGTGSRSGKVEFDPLRENPRASLLLANGMVYLTWASSCDVGPYHGWVMAYDAHTLKQKAVFNASPDADEAAFGPATQDPPPTEGNVSRNRQWPLRCAKEARYGEVC